MKNTFKKAERLTHKTDLTALYKQGKSLKKYPLVLKFDARDFADKEPLKVVFSVPKRRIPHATSRNRIKRILREAYRLNRISLKNKLKTNNKSLALFFIYTGKENPDYVLIEEKIKVLLSAVEETLTISDCPPIE